MITVTARPKRERIVPAIVMPENASSIIGDGLGQSPAVLVQMSYRCESKIHYYIIIACNGHTWPKVSAIMSCPGLYPVAS